MKVYPRGSEVPIDADLTLEEFAAALAFDELRDDEPMDHAAAWARVRNVILLPDLRVRASRAA